MKEKVRLSDYITPKRVLLFFAAVIVYCAFFQAFYNLLKYDTPWPYQTLRQVGISSIYNFIPIFLLALLNILVVFKIPRTEAMKRYLSLKIVVDMIFSAIAWLVVNQVFLLVVRSYDPGKNVDAVGTLLNAILIFMIVEIIYYVLDSRLSLRKAETARREAIQYQYEALKAQVNPHFLFNSLNILYSLVAIDTKKSREFILSLSHMYRYIMSQQNMHTIPLTDELEFLHSYVSILEMRYHNQFSVEIEGKELAGNKTIIPYTMQLLIENVTKHNIISTRYPMTVSIIIGNECVSVSNPVKLKETDSSSGIGLKYIGEQYQRHGKEFGTENDGNTFEAKIPYL